MKTTVTKIKDIKRNWHLIDVKDKILGRIASDIAQKLIGKNKTYFTPNLDCGDYVVVMNASLVQVTGKKSSKKMYYSHSGYPGGFKEKRFDQLLKNNPEKIIIQAVKGMLPKNKLQSKRLKRLKVFTDKNHTYQDKFKNK